MYRWEETLIRPETTIREALQAVDNSSFQVALVVDKDRKLLGTVTDGDIRRAILKNINLEAPASKVMFTDFTAGSIHDTRETLLTLMQSKEIRQIPLLDNQGRVVDLKSLLQMVGVSRRENKVVLMAGGLGTRLQPLTNDCPKPLLHVGGKPILETIMLGFMDHGFSSFYFSVNYKSEMVEKHFGDGSRWGVEITYLREEKRLGTAGCLSLLPTRPNETFMVMNGDLLTRVNFDWMLSFHKENRAMATMGIREYDVEIPFGVVKSDGHRLVNLEEKPLHRFFVNAGVYAFQPEALDFVQPNTYLDMPDLFKKIMNKHEETCVFPIHEYWLDIGRRGDYDRANGEYERHFKSKETDLS